MIKWISAALFPFCVSGKSPSIFELALVQLSVYDTLTASSTDPLLVTINVLSVCVPGNQLVGDTNSSVTVVPYGLVLNSFSIVVVFVKYAIVNPTTPIIATNSSAMIDFFTIHNFPPSNNIIFIKQQLINTISIIYSIFSSSLLPI